MKNAIIVHGSCDKQEYYSELYPSSSNSHWLPWLQKQLLIKEIAAATVEVPNAWQPHYPDWQTEFERFDIADDTILIGHSCGGGFLVRWLSEHKERRAGKTVLVAPWLDPDRARTTDFFDFTIDPDLASRTRGLSIFSSDNDMDSVQKSVLILRASLNNIKYREFHKYGHFCLADMHTTAFPQLLEEIFQ